MIPDKKFVNYIVVDCVKNFKFGIDYVNIRGRLEILNFIFQNLRI